jgi:hypothetical protein
MKNLPDTMNTKLRSIPRNSWFMCKKVFKWNISKATLFKVSKLGYFISIKCRNKIFWFKTRRKFYNLSLYTHSW